MKEHQLIRRAKVTQFVLDTWEARTFEWGVSDCVTLITSALVWAGYDDPTEGKKWGNYRTALRALGDKTIPEWLADLGHEEIPISRILVGDILGGVSETDKMEVSLSLNLGQGYALGFVPLPDGTGKCVVGDAKARLPDGSRLFQRAWRLYRSDQD